MISKAVCSNQTLLCFAGYTFIPCNAAILVELPVTCVKKEAEETPECVVALSVYTFIIPD